MSSKDKFTGSGKENGEQIWPDGSKYIGEFFDGLPNGQGTYFWPDGDKYVGQWIMGKRSGLGIHTRSNGTTYIGEFKDKSTPWSRNLYWFRWKHVRWRLEKR